MQRMRGDGGAAPPASLLPLPPSHPHVQFRRPSAPHPSLQALLGLPKILAENSGYDPQDTLIALQVGGCLPGRVFD